MEKSNNSCTTPSVQKNHQLPVLAADLSASMSLGELSAYIHAVIKQRGFDDERPQDIMLLMVEEVGELAKALRKFVGLKIDQRKEDSYTSAEEEIADVFIYLLDLCNALNIDPFTALKNKELKNEQRFWSSAIKNKP
jgi:NTP pyrophosphatase (non-canonical NTP hydrolase)